MPLITKPARLSLEKASVVALTVGVVSAFVSGFVLAPAEAEQLLGALGAAGAIAFFGVPLSGVCPSKIFTSLLTIVSCRRDGDPAHQERVVAVACVSPFSSHTLASLLFRSRQCLSSLP